MLRNLFAAAHADGLIQRNPAAVMTYQRKYREEIATQEEIDAKTEKVLTPEEEARLLDAAAKAPEKIRRIIYLARFAGLRSGEICGLRAGEVDLSAKRLYVVAAVTRNAERGQQLRYSRGRTKTGKASSDRAVPIAVSNYDTRAGEPRRGRHHQIAPYRSRIHSHLYSRSVRQPDTSSPDQSRC